MKALHDLKRKHTSKSMEKLRVTKLDFDQYSSNFDFVKEEVFFPLGIGEMQIKMIVINLSLAISFFFFFLNCGLWVGGFAGREIFCCILVFCLSTLIFQGHKSVECQL